MAGVFLSYRKADSAGWAGRLNDHLGTRFGSDLVLQDVEDIPRGTNWPAWITTAISQADAVLVVIGPRWIELGGQRMQDPEDVLRQEIEQALASKALVIPVLVGGASIPAATELPTPIQPLLLRQAMTMRDEDWQRSVQILIEALRQAVEKTRDPLPLQEIQASLYGLQGEFFVLLERDAAQALELARRALQLLDRHLPQYPHDAYLQLIRGYFEKNQALALARLDDVPASKAAVTRAEQVFRVMRSELEAQLAGAYNGLGSVSVLEGNLHEALDWIDRALALVPEYPAALHDREMVLAQLGPRESATGTRRKSARKRRGR